MTQIKKFICKHFGHNFEVYPSRRDRFEMAGYCKRCGLCHTAGWAAQDCWASENDPDYDPFDI